jgi:DNA-binding SARP family transcriptional activator
MKELRVQAFGRLRMRYDDNVVASFPTRHVKELLAFFLLNQHTRHGREKLIEILWPESSVDNVRPRFSTALWRLRTLFEELGTTSEHYLQATRNWVAFRPEEALHLDLLSFERSFNEAQSANDDASCERALGNAVALYKGRLYEGIYSDWCLVERERLARMHLRAMGQLMACCMRRDAHREAIDWGRKILRQDPLREEVHRALMYCYWQMGRRPQAVRQFQQCAQALRQELQITPMPETIAIYRQIVEDRLQNAAEESSGPGSLQKELQEAFSEFQQAGQRLNALLDMAE